MCFLRGLVLVLCIPAIGCKSDGGKLVAPDSRPPDLPLVDRSPLEDAGRVDVDVTPRATVVCFQPRHLATSISADAAVRCGINAWMVDQKTVRDQLAKHFELMRLPEKATVAGAWKDVVGASAQVEFVPAASLTVGREYLARIKPQPLLQVDREDLVFHVGSLPRLIGVRFTNSSGSADGKADLLDLEFSEHVDTQTVYAGTRITKQGASKPLGTQPVTGAGAYSNAVGFRLPVDFEDQAVHVIEIGAAVQTKGGVSLDTDYDGTPGGGALTITLKPADFDHKTNKTWVPTVSY